MIVNRMVIFIPVVLFEINLTAIRKLKYENITKRTVS
jgi:hypothetical protein